MPKCRHRTRNFQSMRDFLELGHSDKQFIKNARKRRCTRKDFGAILPRCYQNYNFNGNFNPKMNKNQNYFFPK